MAQKQAKSKDEKQVQTHDVDTQQNESGRLKSGRDSTLVDAEAIQHGTGTVLSSPLNSKVQTVFSKAKTKRKSVDSGMGEVPPIKNKL